MYRADIDGLRAVAVLAVVAFHAFPSALPGGFAGVDVFFVISGYLITGPLLQEQAATGSVNLWAFYARRARRIFPALAVVIVASLAAGWHLMLPEQYAQLGIQALAGAGFFSNVLSASSVGYFSDSAITKPLLHLWSLAIEEQFYLLWPLTIMLVKPSLRWVCVALAVAFVGATAYSFADPGAAYFATTARAWELLVGAALAMWRSDRTREGLAVAGLAGLAVSFILVDKSSPYPGVQALLPVVSTALLIAGGPGSRVAAALSVRPLVWVGLVSYPLYLWHWPILSFQRMTLLEPPSTVQLLLAVLASMVAAVATYLLVERRARLVQAGKAAVTATAALASFAGLAGVVATSEGLPHRIPVDILGAQAAPRPPASWRLGKCFLEDIEKDAFGDCGGSSTVLWGDSHAAALYPGLQAQAGSISQYTVAGCPPMTFNAPCERLHADALAAIAKAKPALVILHASWGDYRTLERLPDSIAALHGMGARVVVVGPVPTWTDRLPAVALRYQRQHGVAPGTRLQTGLVPGIDALEDKVKALALAAGADFVSAKAELCNPDGCLAIVDGKLAYWDDDHLTEPASRLLVSKLWPAITGPTATASSRAAGRL